MNPSRTRTDGRAEGLADRLRDETRSLHIRAEKSGILHAVLKGRASRAGYASLLRNLLPVYEELESGLDRHRGHPALKGIAEPAVYRARALESDLRGLCGPDWRSLPVLSEGRRYASRVREATSGEGVRLIAHAYTRYLGDLNGGQILRRLLAESMDLGSDALAFYAYPDVADLRDFVRRYRSAFDAATGLVDVEVVCEEAQVAFGLNIELSEAVARAAAAGVGDPSADTAR